jgi:rSAM/selenodomain-associated transferase 1
MADLKPKAAPPALALFVRAVRPGHVKTRLALSLGEKPAAEVYRLCVRAALHEMSLLDGGVLRYVFYDGEMAQAERHSLQRMGFRLEAQRGEGLGERLCGCFARLFARGARCAVVMASDVPGLTAGVMQQALLSLEDNRAVIGPCFDGGYYLIGLKRPCNGLFQGIDWGTQRVYRQTLQAAETIGLKMHSLQKLLDIDTGADLRRWWGAQSAGQSPLALYVKTVLAGHGGIPHAR